MKMDNEVAAPAFGAPSNLRGGACDSVQTAGESVTPNSENAA